MGEAKRTQSRSARETLDVGEPSDDWIVLEALISQADPAWWDLDAAPWVSSSPRYRFNQGNWPGLQSLIGPR